MGEASKRAALQLVNMECYHLTAGFFRNLPQEVETGGNPAASLFDQYNDGYIQLIVGESTNDGYNHHASLLILVHYLFVLAAKFDA